MTELEQLRIELTNLYAKRNHLLQLHVLCSGGNLDSLASFIQIGPKTYGFPNLVEAVDSCLKIGVLFAGRFPIASNPTWQFLKLSAYGFQLDSVYATVSKLNLKIGRVLAVPVKRKQPTKKVSLSKKPRLNN